MSEAPITSSFVSSVVPHGFADLADSLDQLAGREISVGKVRLSIQERVGHGLAGAAWYSGVLRTGSGLLPLVHVDVVVSPWSAGRSEVGIRPLTRIGRIESVRARRFFQAAWAVMPELIDRLAEQIPAEAPLAAPVPAAA